MVRRRPILPALSEIRALIVDDTLLADALAARLAQDSCVAFVAAESTLESAGVTIARHRPNVVIVVLGSAGGEDGTSVIREAHERYADIPILVIPDDDPDAAIAAVRAGAVALVERDSSAEELIGALHRTIARQVVMPEHLFGRIVEELQRTPVPDAAEELLQRLTAKEREVLGLLVAGFDYRAIAEELYLSINTVRTHGKRILAKLGVHSTLAAVSVALRAGLRP